MRVTTDDVGRWTRGIGMAAVVALAWAVFAPSGVFWTAVLAAGLVGSTVATALLVRSRQVPSLSQVITTAEADPAPVTRGDMP